MVPIIRLFNLKLIKIIQKQHKQSHTQINRKPKMIRQLSKDLSRNQELLNFTRFNIRNYFTGSLMTRNYLNYVVQPLFRANVFVPSKHFLLSCSESDGMRLIFLVCQVSYIIFAFVLQNSLHNTVFIELFGVYIVFFLRKYFHTEN